MPFTATVAAGLVVPLILSGEPRGALFEGRCDAAGAVGRLSELPGLYRGAETPIIVSTGDLLGPEPLSGYALEGPPEVQANLRSLLQRLDGSPLFDAALPGNLELAADPSRVERLGRPDGVPWTVANVDMAAPHRPHRVFVRSGVRVGLTAVFDEALAPVLSPSRRPPIHPAAAELERSVRVLRKAGVHFVVALVHLRRSDGLRRVIELLEEAEDRPELVLTSSMQGDPTLIRLDGLGVTIVSAPREPSEATVIQLVTAASGLPSIRAERRPVEPMPSGPADVVRNWVCNQLDIPIGPASPEPGRIERQAFIRSALETVRRLADAEVAALPVGAFGEAAAFPLSDPPTRLEVRRALRSEEGLRVVSVRGSDLSALRARLDHPQVVRTGFDSAGVTGRPIDPLRMYRVVTTAFLADGGDNVLVPGGYPFRAVEEVPSLRQAVVSALERDGMRSWPSEQPTLLDVRVNIGANLKSVSVSNPRQAEAPQLTRRDFLQVGGDLSFRVVLDLPEHRLELLERTRFGIVREVPVAGGDVETTENEDVTTVELAYASRIAPGLEKPWIPDASASARLETELTVPEERSFRRALLQSGLGPSWRLASNLSIRSQLGLRRELLASFQSSDPNEAALAEARVAILSTAELRDEVIDGVGGRKIVFNLRLDHSIDLTGQVQDNLVQGRIALDVPIIQGLDFTVAADVYLLERQQVGQPSLSAAALDTSFGLKSTADLSRAFY